MATAMDLFAARGYAETTVSEIAATAGISERSFFRYFASKEDVVLSSLDRLGEALVDRLAHLPPDLPAWPALRTTFTVVADLYDGNPQRYLAILGLRENTPALTAHYLERRARWQDQMVPHLIPRLPDWPPRTGSGDTGDSGESALPDPRPRAVAGAALACLGAAETAW
jgi:AcrR family transcriptional regulator